MRTSAITFLILFITSTLFAQDYDELIMKAETAYNDSSYAESGEYYELALKLNLNAHYRHYYNAACSWSLAGNSDKSIQYLGQAFELGWHDFNFMYYDLDLDNIRNYDGYLAIEKRYRPDSIIYYFDIINDLNSSDGMLIYASKRIELNTDIPNYSVRHIRKRLGITVNDSLLNFMEKSLVFTNCRINGELRFLNLKKLILLHTEADILSLADLHIREKFNMINSETSSKGVVELTIQNSYLNGYNIAINSGEFSLYNATLNDPEYGGGIKVRGLKNSLIERTLIMGNKFLNNQEGYPSQLELKTKYLYMSGNFIDDETDFNNSVISEVSEIWNNEFLGSVNISQTVFPEFNNYFPFEQLQNGLSVRLFSTTKRIGSSFSADRVTAKHPDIYKPEIFDRIIKNYQFLNNNYKQNGDLVSANECFITIKNLYLEREKYLYNETGNMDHWIRYRLYQVLKIYTDHGTNPAKAIIASMYIILAFAVFYFFFPSEWDTTSKGKLISNFKDFTQKNDKGYVKPFFLMLGGFILSLINAITLSLNSFVTLGFGTIPTSGLARYICILQGFIGWFLLSIFTVALINQVLA